MRRARIVRIEWEAGRACDDVLFNEIESALNKFYAIYLFPKHFTVSGDPSFEVKEER